MDLPVKKLDQASLPECSNCLAVDLKLSACTGCFVARYCSKPCQLQHWRAIHKLDCMSMQAQRAQAAVKSPAAGLPVGTSARPAAESTEQPQLLRGLAECAICLESLLASGCTILRCGHLLHSACYSMLPPCSVPDGSAGPTIQCPHCRKVQVAATAKVLHKSEVFYAVASKSVRSGKCSWALLGGEERACMSAAIRLWENSVRVRNDPIGKYYLGLVHFEGHGVSLDPAKGLFWMRQAAGEGVVCAQGDLGRRYFTGNGVVKDEKESLAWTLAAAKNGDAESQVQMSFLEQGLAGSDRSCPASLTWAIKAAEQGNTQAEVHVAKCCFYGQGAAVSLPAALKWFTCAASRGQYDAQLYVGLMFYLGEGVGRDFREAFRWFVKASEQGPQGQYLLAMAYAFGNGVQQSYDASVALLHKAARYGHPGACYQLAVAYGHGYGASVDKERALAWATQALKLGYWDADNWLPEDRPSPAVGIKIKLLTEASSVHWAMWFRHARSHKRFGDCVVGDPLNGTWVGYMEGGSLQKREQ